MNLSLRVVTLDNADEILAIYKKSPTYFEKVDGAKPTLKTVEVDLAQNPPNTVPSFSKQYVLIENDGGVIGAADLVANHPEDGIGYIGLLLIAEDLVGRGIGTRCYNFIEDYMKQTFKVTRIRLAVSDENEVSGFWRKLGYRESGKVSVWQGQNKVSRVVEFEKSL